MKVSTHPLTPERFADLDALFAAKGCSFARSCWCMVYREVGMPKPAQGISLARVRKAKLLELSRVAPAPGLLGYDRGGRPVGWVAVGPRESFAKLARSPVMKPVDALPVWSVVCFVVPSPYRGQGIAKALLEHALRHARDAGARILEGYPIDKPERSQPQWLWHGTRSMFAAAGFEEVARRKPERPVMRRTLRPRR